MGSRDRPHLTLRVWPSCSCHTGDYLDEVFQPREVSRGPPRFFSGLAVLLSIGQPRIAARSSALGTSVPLTAALAVSRAEMTDSWVCRTSARSANPAR